jgi:hypothetical protein
VLVEAHAVMFCMLENYLYPIRSFRMVKMVIRVENLIEFKAEVKISYHRRMTLAWMNDR